MVGNSQRDAIGNVRDLQEIDLRRLIEYLKVSHPTALKEAMEAMYIQTPGGSGTRRGGRSGNVSPVIDVTEVTEIETTTTLSSMMQDLDLSVLVSNDGIENADIGSDLTRVGQFVKKTAELTTENSDNVDNADNAENEVTTKLADNELPPVAVSLEEISEKASEQESAEEINESKIIKESKKFNKADEEYEDSQFKKINKEENDDTKGHLQDQSDEQNQEIKEAEEGHVQDQCRKGTEEKVKVTKKQLKANPSDPQTTEKGCYLVYDPSSNGRLMMYYSKIAIPNAMGFWAPSPNHKIQEFKFKRNLGRNELIGNCAAGVTGRKNYYSGWCQFIRAAKALKGSVVIYPRNENQGLDVDIYVYYKPPFEVNGQQTIQLQENVPFDLANIAAVTCLPKQSTLFDEYAKIDLNHWMTVSSKVGASTAFSDSESAADAAFMAHLLKGKNYEPTKFDTAALNAKREKTKPQILPLDNHEPEHFSEVGSISTGTSDTVSFEVTTKPPAPIQKNSKPYPPTIPASFMDDSEFQLPTLEEASITQSHTGCYLVYNLDGAKLMVHYSKEPVPNALGFWQPSNKYKIQGFKFKQNYGKNDLQTNCASGVTGRKNYYSGICQFIRMAKNLDGTIYLYNKADKPGLDVDVYVYYDELSIDKSKSQTFKIEPETAFYTAGIQAVTCLPKHADFFEDKMTIDLNHWLTKASSIGAASRFVS